MQLIENYVYEELWLVVLYPYYLNEENTVTTDSCIGYHKCSFYSLVFIACALNIAIEEKYVYFICYMDNPSSICFSSHKKDHF